MRYIPVAAIGGLALVLTACSSSDKPVVITVTAAPRAPSTSPSSVLPNVGDQEANAKVCADFEQEGQTFYDDLYGHTDSINVDPTRAYVDMERLGQLSDDTTVERTGTDLRVAAERLRTDAASASEQFMTVASSDDVGPWVQSGGLKDLTASFAAVSTACSAAGHGPSWSS